MYIYQFKDDVTERLRKIDDIDKLNRKKLKWAINIDRISKGIWYLQDMPHDILGGILEFVDADTAWILAKRIPNFRYHFKRKIYKLLEPLFNMKCPLQKMHYIMNTVSTQLTIGHIYMFYQCMNIPPRFYPHPLLRMWLTPIEIDVWVCGGYTIPFTDGGVWESLLPPAPSTKKIDNSGVYCKIPLYNNGYEDNPTQTVYTLDMVGMPTNTKIDKFLIIDMLQLNNFDCCLMAYGTIHFYGYIHFDHTYILEEISIYYPFVYSTTGKIVGKADIIITEEDIGSLYAAHCNVVSIIKRYVDGLIGCVE